MRSRSVLFWGRHLTEPSPWRGMDPRVRLLSSSTLAGVALVSTTGRELALTYFFLAVMYRSSRVDRHTLWRGLRPFAYLLLLTVVFQLVFTPGQGGGSAAPFSSEGLRLSLVILLRMCAVIMSSTILFTTTSPVELSRSLAWVIAPTARIGVPVSDLVTVFNLGFHFFPIVLEEGWSLRLALESRGISLKHPRIFMRLRALAAWMSALFTASLERSQRLALALEVKGAGKGSGLHTESPTLNSASFVGLWAVAAAVVSWMLIRHL